MRHEKKVDPVELYAPINYFCGPELQYDRVKYHLDAMMGTISVGPPRFVNY